MENQKKKKREKYSLGDWFQVKRPTQNTHNKNGTKIKMYRIDNNARLAQYGRDSNRP